MTRKNITDIISALLAILFTYAAINKIIDHDIFITQISKSPMLSSFAVLVGYGIPTVEIFIVALLLLPKVRDVGLYLSFFLLLIFTTYLITILNFSYYIPCSCGGILQGLSWKAHIAFNSLFMVLALVGIVVYRRERIPKVTINDF
jgi:hypothetical protein